MVNSDKDFRELERALASGDADAFTRIYGRYRDKVYSFAYRMLGVRSVADEVTQEAFLALIKHPERYQAEKGSMLTFLCAVARNCILNHYRRRDYLFEDSYEEDKAVVINAGDEPNPLRTLLEQELAAKVNEAIELLPPLQREVIVLREFQELSYEEISIVTGASVNVVKARLHRARQNLASRLAPYMNLRGERCYELRRD